MSRVSRLANDVDTLNAKEIDYESWVVFLLTSIADSLATIADTLQEQEEGTE